MTYCVGLCVDDGVVMLADTRTNAGLDNIATFGKLFRFEVPGERAIALATAGNLAVTQAVLSRIADEDRAAPGTLWTVSRMVDAARLVGEAVRGVYAADGEAMQAQNVTFDATFLLAGQIAGRKMRLFQIYAAGNYIEATSDTPFLQIGEHKYGKPILDRVARFDTPLEDAVKLALISMDSTLRSNLSVGLPMDLIVYPRDAIAPVIARRIGEDDPYFRGIRQSWSDALRNAYRDLPPLPWGTGRP